MFDVVGFGENSIDEVLRLPALPNAGTPTAKLRIRDRSTVPGGQVATTMAACAAFGLRARYIGAFGNDAAAAIVRRELEHRGVDTTAAIVRPVANRRAVILVDDEQGERLVLWDRDERLTISPADVRREWFADARALHVDAVDAAASIVAARMAREAGLEVTTDIDTRTDDTEALLAAATAPIVAEHALTALTGEPDPQRALRALRQRHSGLLCVTLGQKGAMLLAGDRLHHQPAFAVDVVDSTSAGDVFRAGFLYGLLTGLAADQILRFACAAAALACTRAGAMASVPSLNDVDQLLRR